MPTTVTETVTETENQTPTVRVGSSVKRDKTTAIRDRTTESQTITPTAMAEATKGVATNEKMSLPSTILCAHP